MFNGVIDLSHHNTVTNWDSVKNDGVIAIVHKATEGRSYRDKEYHNLHSPSGVSFEVKIACIRALDKDFLPQAAPAVAQTAGSGRIRPRSRCFLAQGRRFSAQRTDLSSRFRSV
jgi:hypothetical protein